jgi:hypothetical protein
MNERNPMNKQQEQEAIDILLAGNALDDLRALVRNAPREHSLHAMLEFLEGTHEYIRKVLAFIRALEPTIAPQRPELAGVGAPSLRPHYPSKCIHGVDITCACVSCAPNTRELPQPRLTCRCGATFDASGDGAIALGDAMSLGWAVNMVDPENASTCPKCRKADDRAFSPSRKGAPKPDPSSPAQN